MAETQKVDLRPVVEPVVTELLKPLLSRIAELEKAVAELKQAAKKPSL